MRKLLSIVGLLSVFGVGTVARAQHDTAAAIATGTLAVQGMT